jgi:ribonucleoside-diphosphate reductase alpha chain
MESEQESLTVEKKGLQIPRYFTKEGVKPIDMFTYEKRSSVIKNPDGSTVFEMHDVEVPHFWTQVATDILSQKYFRKAGVPLKNEAEEALLDETGQQITGSETSIKQVAHRIAGCWRLWGEKHGYFATPQDAVHFYEEMKYMIINQSAAPNSPQWFTTGLNFAYGITGSAQGHSYVDPQTKKLEFSKDAYSRSQPHACFIQSVEDDLVTKGGIFDLLTREARIFKYGSGTGSNFSRIRGKGEKLSGGGTSSGLMSFLKIFDAAAGSIKSGGTTRRAAKMVSLDLDHPEIEDFIWWKVREEEKVASLVAGSKTLKLHLTKLIELAKGKENPLEDPEVKKVLKQAVRENIPLNYIVRALDLAKQGYGLPLQEFDTHYESEAYLTVAGQNSNNSVRIPNEFFHALDNGSMWELKGRKNGEIMKTFPASELWDDIGYCAWASADPGVQYDTTINEWHTCPNDGQINGSNPCSEYMFLDDTACNLASINLIKLYNKETGIFDIAGFRHTIRLWTIALEISVLMAQFPSESIAMKSFEYRTLGLGYANVGSLLMMQSIPYDSDKARSIAGALAAIMTGDSYATSAEMARVLQPFERYPQNKESMLRVIRNHRKAAYNQNNYERLTITPYPINQELCPSDLLQASHSAWDNALNWGEQYGYRNAQTTVIAPTGTIGLVMDCDTTGVEPDYAIVKYKKLAGGGFFKIVNQSVPNALRRLGYSDDQTKDIIDYCLGHGTLQGAPFINTESLRAKGLNNFQLEAVEKELKNTMDCSFTFNAWTLGEEYYNNVMAGKQGNFLEAIGFTKEQIDTANEYICGTMTLEGAPHLQEQHMEIFDCANTCGKKGKRYIHPYGHLKMVAAVQSFISGAISKTINMPSDWNVEQIKQAYYDGWKMMTKAVALYRDSCKLSQPLNSTLESNSELKEILSNLEDNVEDTTVRKTVSIGPKELHLAGEMDSGKLMGVNFSMEGMIPVQKVMMEALVSSVNMGLQNGMSPSLIAAQSLSVEGHPMISALGDFIREFETNDQAAQHIATAVMQGGTPSISITQSASILVDSAEEEKCGGCGATQLRQNGTCKLCEVCGSTSGCS